MRAKKGPQIKVMALKTWTVEKAMNHYARKKITTCCKLSYFGMVEQMCQKEKNHKELFFFDGNKI